MAAALRRRGAWAPSRGTLRRLALASVVANIGIVVTGGAVRLTSSGLGCPTWPRCTDESYVTTPEMGVHGVIEFGNRLLTFAVGLIALAGVVAAVLRTRRDRAAAPAPGARPAAGRPPSVLRPAVLVLLGIPAQAVVGGLTVLTDLNPWVVGCHFLVSMAIIAAAYVFWRRTVPAPPAAPVPGPLRTLAWLTVLASAAVTVVGTVVTGSGPHSGDAGARRTGLDLETVSQVHVDLVFLLLGLSVALWLALRAVGAPRPAVRAAATLVLVELAQGLVGAVQYATGLPAVAVGLHMLGACLVWLATVAVLYRTGGPRAAAPADPGCAGRAPASAPPAGPASAADAAAGTAPAGPASAGPGSATPAAVPAPAAAPSPTVPADASADPVPAGGPGH